MLGMHFSKKSMLFQNKYRKLQNKYRKVTAWGYKFHALAVYLHPTFKIPSQSEAYLEPSRTSAMELQAANNFRKKLHRGCWAEFSIRLCPIIYYSLQKV